MSQIMQSLQLVVHPALLDPSRSERRERRARFLHNAVLARKLLPPDVHAPLPQGVDVPLTALSYSLFLPQ